MNARVALAGVVFLVLAACASAPLQPLAPAPPVKVIVSAEPTLHKLIDVDKITAQTELALRRYASSAAPATVTVHFTGTTLMNVGRMVSAEIHGSPEPVTFTSSVPILSPTPWGDGFQPVVSTYTVPASTWVSGLDLVVEGTYSITDANGVTLEEDTVVIQPGFDQPLLAKMMAKRVAKLARKSS
jgi:hypothetical protein